MPIAPGQALGHYRLVEKAGKGGMGVVWKAVDLKLDREVAIKFLPDRTGADPQWLEGFEREARALAGLNHPHIVTIYAIEEAEDRPFFAMEYVSGTTLATRIPRGGLPPEAFLELAIPIADAISAAHERSITHLDLKPGNIMVDDDGLVKVLDFGLAQPRKPAEVSDMTGHQTETRGREHRITGTLAYMSPEQLRGKSLDHRSDIFSLGTIFYEMASGHLPFHGETPVDLIASILRDAPRPVVELNSVFPQHLGRIIGRCLEKDPQRRLQSALDLRNDLEQLRREQEPERSEPGSSIAVLPFADLSRDKDQDYFCEGIAEEIINVLTKLEDLHVVPRISTFALKGTELDRQEIGRRLQVNHLLEGSVRKAGRRLRITVRLIDVAGGHDLWSERYDREMKDVFAIQDEIAASVLQALRLTLSPRERHALRQAKTTDVKAYEYYLRGRKFYYEYRKRGVEFALEMFARAITVDPHFARAYAGIADCRAFLYLYADRCDEHRLQAEAASRKALELCPQSAEAHASHGVALTLSDRNDEAVRAFETAIRLDPKLFEAHYFYARTCFTLGQAEKAIRLYEKAMEVRPEDYQSPFLVAQIYEDLGRKEEADAVRRRGFEIVEEQLKLNPDDLRALYMAANGLAALGEKERSLEWANRALALDPEEPMLLYNVGCIKSLLGRVDEAIDCLEKSVGNGLTQKEWLQRDSNLDPLRDHPRFRTLMERLG